AWSRPKARAANPFDDGMTNASDDGFAPRTEDLPSDDAFTPAAEPKTRNRRKAPSDEASNPFATETGELVGAHN
ncbi:hypothetical protein, partial [Tardiphaga sp.]|uniref:hypothetical protein n=1 Tax=Tardiphaga sp. TaxID=1926292 RepID=UPI00352B1107